MNPKQLYSFLLLTAALCNITSDTSAQKTARTATGVLKKLQQKLGSFSTVSYTQTRETRYFADNYQNLMKGDLYMDFDGKGPIGMRFQGEDDKSLFIYDGKMILRLSKENLTIDSASALTYQSIQSNSYLYHSLAMLRRMIPIVLANDTIIKTLSDTVIGKRKYDNVHIEGEGMYFQLLGGIEHHTVKDLKRPYQLLIDQQTGLPYQFIAKYVRGTDDRDYVTVTYSHINSRPAIPTASSWNYTAYAGTYSPYIAPVKIPVIKPGANVPGFILPAYTPAGTDSIHLSTFAGKLVLLDFWFKSCSPCMEAMPHYNELQNAFDKKDFVLLTVNVEDPVEDIAFFYNKHKPVYPMIYHGNKLWKSLGFTGCPSAILIGKDGKVVEAFYGFNQEILTKKITALVNLKVND